jgi:hypothetical protein
MPFVKLTGTGEVIYQLFVTYTPSYNADRKGTICTKQDVMDNNNTIAYIEITKTLHVPLSCM